MVFDLLSRRLRATGYSVVLCRNVTDIDDKILARSEEEGRPWWAVASFYEREFQRAYDVLGCAPPTVEPRATGHVTQMIELIARLIDRGHAYESDGDVYFDVRSFAEYGALSRQDINDLRPAADSGVDPRKRDPATLLCGRRQSLQMSQVGRLRGVQVAQAGTWNVRPWQRRTSGHNSISTAAAWTWSSRIMRTRLRSRAQQARSVCELLASQRLGDDGWRKR